MAKRVDKQVNLFYCAECEELARKVADHSDAIQLRTISWRCPSQRTPRATYPTAVEDDSSKETNRIPTPKVIIDQDSNLDATIIEVAFGDRLGALLATVYSKSLTPIMFFLQCFFFVSRVANIF
ncbi:uncharacterized protein LOC121999909 [Zingiber officinale]|uniref:uncharacterized protein LOC121999909 n=1 Tax=Zingiber officinale TaxID=94328 RepID=UPI001C4B1F42|nr:uncharacterized protein LOC121999909 [Zingiber officinale]